MWLDSRKLLAQVDGNAAYLSCAVGLRTINPLKIVGLSRPFEDIANDGRMERLRARVASQGWVDQEGGESCHMCLLPDLRLVVCQNGNHRTILAHELGLERMRVELLVFVPKREVSEWLTNKHIECVEAWDQCVKLYREADDAEDEREKTRLWCTTERLESRCRAVSAYIGRQHLKGIDLL